MVSDVKLSNACHSHLHPRPDHPTPPSFSLPGPETVLGRRAAESFTFCGYRLVKETPSSTAHGSSVHVVGRRLAGTSAVKVKRGFGGDGEA